MGQPARLERLLSVDSVRVVDDFVVEIRGILEIREIKTD